MNTKILKSLITIFIFLIPVCSQGRNYDRNNCANFDEFDYPICKFHKYRLLYHDIPNAGTYNSKGLYKIGKTITYNKNTSILSYGANKIKLDNLLSSIGYNRSDAGYSIESCSTAVVNNKKYYFLYLSDNSFSSSTGGNYISLVFEEAKKNMICYCIGYNACTNGSNFIVKDHHLFFMKINKKDKGASSLDLYFLNNGKLIYNDKVKISISILDDSQIIVGKIKKVIW